MDAFRWILLVIGVIIFLLIFILSKKSKPVAKSESMRQEPVFHEAFGEPAPKLDLSEFDALVESSPEPQDTLDDEVSMPPLQASTRGETQQNTDKDEKLIVFYLVEKHGGLLSGSDIIASLEQAGMRYGDMKIFHYYMGADPLREHSVFSIANLTDPGTFDLVSIDTMKTPGLSLFLQLPVAANSVHVFDEMLQVIDKLQKLLPVQVRDKSKNIVSMQMLSHIREEVLEFERMRAKA